MRLLSFFMAGCDGGDKKPLLFFLAASLSILVPVPARLAFGVMMLVAFNLQVLFGLLFLRLIRLLGLWRLKNPLMLLEAAFAAVLAKQLFALVCPVAAFTLGFAIFLPAFSSSLMDILFSDGNRLLREDMRSKLSLCGGFTVVALSFFLVRELVGYGTLTVIVRRRLVAFPLFGEAGDTAACSFLASVPGALVLLALLLALYLAVGSRLVHLHRSAA